ncbi:MAG: ROK family protein [Spirochaetes bacterium]|nr:ROK family protein [Spirochaetota bacterium]
MYIGLDIGGTTIKGILTDKTGKIYKTGKIDTENTTKAIIDSIIHFCETLITSQNMKINQIDAIGIGVAGAIDPKKGKIIVSPNIHALDNCPLAQKINKKLNVPVFIENDANVALLGEFWQGNGKKYKNWIMLTLGTGVGGGAIINGEMMKGRDGFAAEFGHINVYPDGNLCGCGNKGCLETYASAKALVRYSTEFLGKNKNSSAYKRSLTEGISSKLIYDEAKKGDKASIQIIRYVGQHLGIGVASLINTFNPEAIIFAGGLSRAIDLLLPVIKEEVEKRAMKGLKDKIKYHIVKHEDKGPALGAIKNAIDQLG